MDLKSRLRGSLDPTPVAESDAPGAAAAAKPEWSAHDRLAVRAMTDIEREWQQRVYRELMEMIDLSAIGEMNSDEARKQIGGIIDRLLVQHSAPLSAVAREVVTRSIQDEILGLGPLEPLLADPSITDILVNGPKQIPD